jgi:GTP-binding protein EngB required for normal cell division
LVFNKIDKIQLDKKEFLKNLVKKQIIKEEQTDKVFFVSTLTGEGLGDLKKFLYERF